jgi:hypothetical protein
LIKGCSPANDYFQSLLLRKSKLVDRNCTLRRHKGRRSKGHDLDAINQDWTRISKTMDVHHHDDGLSASRCAVVVVMFVEQVTTSEYVEATPPSNDPLLYYCSTTTIKSRQLMIPRAMRKSRYCRDDDDADGDRMLVDEILFPFHADYYC